MSALKLLFKKGQKMNQSFTFQKLVFPGVYLIKPYIIHDSRGSFIKDYSKEVFAANNIKYDLKEVYYTESRKGVIRAIHFQSVKEQPKLIRCVCGSIFEIIVDLRNDSPYFGQWRAFMLNGGNQDQILIPVGCGHGYIVLEDSIVSYKCAETMYDEYDDGIIWNDREIAIQWPFHKIGGIDNIILSDKDRQLQTFAQFKNKLKSRMPAELNLA